MGHPCFNFSSSCHPDAVESSAKPTTPNEGSMHLAASDKSIDPSSRKNRAPQDDSSITNSASSAVNDVDVFRALVRAGQRLAEIHVHYEDQPEYPLTKTEKA